MLAVPFLLYIIAIGLVLLEKRLAAIWLTLFTIVVMLGIFWHHMTDILPIRF